MIIMLLQSQVTHHTEEAPHLPPQQSALSEKLLVGIIRVLVVKCAGAGSQQR